MMWRSVLSGLFLLAIDIGLTLVLSDLATLSVVKAIALH